MKNLIEISLILCTIYVFSFFKWCLNHDKTNIIGNISVFILGLSLVAIIVVIYTRVN